TKTTCLDKGRRMTRTLRVLGTVVLVLAAPLVVGGDTPAGKRPREALQAFNDLIGSWRCTGQPEGTRAERQRGFWTEAMAWEWQFKGDDAWLEVAFDKGKHFTKGELRYLPGEDRYRFTVETPAKETLTFVGALADRRLTLERNDAGKNEQQRPGVSLLQHNR